MPRKVTKMAAAPASFVRSSSTSEPPLIRFSWLPERARNFHQRGRDTEPIKSRLVRCAHTTFLTSACRLVPKGSRLPVADRIGLDDSSTLLSDRIKRGL